MFPHGVMHERSMKHGLEVFFIYGEQIEMAVKKLTVDEFFSDLSLLDGERFAIATSLRSKIKALAADVEEKIMYGGVLYYMEDSFCGIFSYKTHVTLEFGEGARLSDKHHVLEGSGKLRRHIKFKTLEEVKGKHADFYIKQAIALLTE